MGASEKQNPFSLRISTSSAPCQIVLIRKKFMNRLLLIALIWLVNIAMQQQTVLQQAVASIQPGQWLELQTVGLTQDLLLNGFIGNITGYADSAMWDPVLHKFFFMGSPHSGGVGNPKKFIWYDEASNSWFGCNDTDPNCGPITLIDAGHSYDHNAIDPIAHTFYRRAYFTNKVSAFNLVSAPLVNWSALPIYVPVGQWVNVAGGLAWFPELYNGGGGLVFVQGGYGEVFLWNKVMNSWTKAATGLVFNDIHNFAEYDLVNKIVVFGGGTGTHGNSMAIYRIDASGNILRLADALVALGVTKSVIAADPVTGNLIVMATAGQWYVYDYRQEVWTLQSLPCPVLIPLPGGSNSDTTITDVVGTPVSNYGITMWLRYGNPPRVWLYKHFVSNPLPPLLAPILTIGG